MDNRSHRTCSTNCEYVISPIAPSEIWTCYDCGRELKLTPQKLSDELAAISTARKHDQELHENCHSLHSRGITVDYLNSLTDRFDCWDWPTWQVVRDIVKSKTASTRERYADLIAKSNSDAIGPADVFMSHSWAARWGALVAAASRDCTDGKRKVWIDAFAVRQWNGNEADLDFKGVIGLCRSVMIVLSHEFFLESSDEDWNIYLPHQKTNYSHILESAVRKKLPFARSWCLAEMHAAIEAQKPLLILSGQDIVEEDSKVLEKVKLKLQRHSDTISSQSNMYWSPSRPFAVSYFGPLESLSLITKLEYAEAGRSDDQEMIHRMIESSIGFQQFNSEVRGSIKMGSMDEESLGILPFMCDGDKSCFIKEAAKLKSPMQRSRLLSTVSGIGSIDAIDILLGELNYEVNDSSMAALGAACGCGRLDVAKHLIHNWGGDVNILAGNGNTPLAFASLIGHLQIVRLLLKQGADPNIKCFRGETAIIKAAIIGSDDVILELFKSNANPNIPDDDGDKAIHWATRGGHLRAIRTLIKQCGVDPNEINQNTFYTPLHIAAYYGEIEVATLLVELGARIDFKAKDGHTPLSLGAASKRAEASHLLRKDSVDINDTKISVWEKSLILAFYGNRWKKRCLSESEKESIDLLCEKALKASEEGDYQASLTAWQQILNIEENPYIFNNKGITLGKMNCHEESMECCLKAIELLPTESDFWLNAGRALAQTKNNKGAENFLQMCTTLNPRNASGWFNMAIFYNINENWEKSAKCYDRVLTINPEDANIWHIKGSIMRRIGNVPEEFKCYEKSLEYNPSNAEVWLKLGIAYGNEKKNHQKAIECFDTCLGLEPDNGQAWYCKGIALQYLNKDKEANLAFLNSKKYGYYD